MQQLSQVVPAAMSQVGRRHMRTRLNIHLRYNVNISDKDRMTLARLQTSLSKREKLNIKFKERSESKNCLRENRSMDQ